MRKVVSLLAIIIFCNTLTSCFDAQEVTDYAYVYSLGLDKGKSDKLRLSMQLTASNVASGTSYNEGVTTEKGGNNIVVLSVDCPTFFVGLNMINCYISRELNFNHTVFMVFSDDLSREGIDPFVNGIIRTRGIRRDLFCIVSKGSAREFLINNIPTVTTSLSRMEKGLMFQSKKTGFFPMITYGELTNGIKSPVEQPLLPLGSPNTGSSFYNSSELADDYHTSGGSYKAGKLPRKGGNISELFGSAVFDGGKMVGELTGDETRFLLMVRDEFRKGYFSFDDPLSLGKMIVLDVRKQKSPDINVKFINGIPIIKLKLFLEADITSIQSTKNYDSLELKPLLEDTLENSIKNQLDHTIDKCKELKSDVLKLGKYASKNFKTSEQLKNYDWLKNFQNSEIHTDVELSIRRNGTKVYNSQIMPSGENP